MSSAITTPRTVPSPLKLRISTRQLAEGAYRALRVSGVPSGVAADAAADAVELEREHGRGLEVLEEILSLTDGPPQLAIDPAESIVEAGGTSALLIAVPPVALACERSPAPVTVLGLAHCAALQPALARIDRDGGASTVDGADVLRVRGGCSTIGPAWNRSWGSALDVRLTVERPPTEGGTEARPPAGHPRSAHRHALLVDGDRWRRLSERSARYLV